MLQSYDTNQLLELIEGDLDARSASEVEHRLAADPAAAELVNRLRADRAALRSVPEPELPMDFLAAIEPVLARPMLMEPALPAGMANAQQLRRQHRRQTHRIRWGRLTGLAALLAVSVMGVWAVLFNDKPAEPGDTRVAQAPVIAATPEPVNELPLQGTVHHHSPLPMYADAAAHIAAREAQAPQVAHAVPSTGRPERVVSDVALVVHNGSASAVEAALARAATVDQRVGSLVRNFSYAEAQSLERQWRLAQGRSPQRENQPMTADASGASPRGQRDLTTLAERVRDQLRKQAPSSNDTEGSEVASGTIAGAADLGPSLEQQLDFSSRGAAYTLAIPASQLRETMERLALMEGQTTSLRMLSREGGGAESDFAHPLSSWISEGPAVRRAMERLSSSREATVVLVPVFVRPLN